MTSKNKHKEKKREKKEEEVKKEEEKTKRHPLSSLVYPFKVIVSPLKAFKEIAQNPEFKGFFLIIVLFLAASIGVQYAYASKILVSTSNPQPIQPKRYIFSDSNVYVTTFGNYTFKSSQPNSINYTFIDDTPLAEYSVFSVNTTETLTVTNPLVSTNTNDTFYQITTDLNRSATKVGNFTLTAEFSQDERPKFSVILNKTAEWNLSDFTINWFIRSPDPYIFLANRTTTIDLASATGLSLLETNVTSAELGSTNSINDWRFSILSDWSDYGTATVYGGNLTFFTHSGTWLDVVFGANDSKIDFATVSLTYSAFVNTIFFGDYALSYEIYDIVTFLLRWVIYAGILLLIAKVFGEERKEESDEEESKKKSSWRPFFIIIGYAFSVFIVHSAVNTLLISTFPAINFQVATWPPTDAGSIALANEKLNVAWGSLLANHVGTYFNLLVELWFTVLVIIAVHASRRITWGRAVMLAGITFFIYFILRDFIGL